MTLPLALAPAHDAQQARLRAVARLVELGEAIARRAGGCAAVDDGARLVAYLGRSRERIARVEVSAPWMVFVLEGHKLAQMGTSHLVRAGEALLLPRGARLGVVNVPSPDTGHYRALCVELLGDAHSLLRRHHPDLISGGAAWLGASPATVRAGLGALQALAHVCETVLDPAAHPRLLHHRIEGLLLSLLLEQRSSPSEVACAQGSVDVVRAVQNLVREAPGAALRADQVARRLGLSEATLRRRLTLRGTSLRKILLDERMTLADALLADGRLAVGEVALRCGYASPGKFSRQFVRRFGRPPRGEPPR